MSLRLFFVLATEHTLLCRILNIWSQLLFPGDLHDAALWNFCTVESGTFNCPRNLQLPARLSNYQFTFTELQGVLIVSTGKFTLSSHYTIKRRQSFEKHFAGLTVVMSNVMMINNCPEYGFCMESLLLCGNKPFHFR